MRHLLFILLAGSVALAWPTQTRAANRLDNGDFAAGLDGWSSWTVRDGNGDFAAEAIAGELSVSGTDIEGGAYQQFNTGGTGSVVTIVGHWRSDPTLADAMSAEVWVINANRVPADGVDEVDGANHAILLYRNDTFLGRGAWDDAIPKSAMVDYEASFVAAGGIATIILATGNTGPATLTGTKFDDMEARSVPPPATLASLPADFESRSYTFPTERLVSMAQSPVSHHVYAISNNQEARS